MLKALRGDDLADFDVVVLGAGPGGYVAAIRAAQLGLKTAIIERDSVGGVCLNWGCIPSKSLLRNAEVVNLVNNAEEFGITFENLTYDFSKAISRSREVVDKLTSGVQYLLKKNQVELIEGTGKLTGPHELEIMENSRKITSENIIIATGARQRDIDSMPIDHHVVLNSRDALNMSEIPEDITIIGAGATGVEFAHIYRSYGAKVTLVEMMDRIIPNEDSEISESLKKSFTEREIDIRVGVAVKSIQASNGTALVTLIAKEEEHLITSNKVLVAVGVQPNTDKIGLEKVGITTNNGFISISENMETNVSGVYAIGDVTGKMLLAHVASAQAVTAVEYIAGLNPAPLDYQLMPRAIYCEPQVASFGMTEAQAKDNGIETQIGRFPFSASGKAIALGHTEGIVKLVIDPEIGEILGAHMIGPEVTELLAELSMTKLLEGTTTELGWLVHPHPTISETLKEAALDSTNEAIHI
ncbi:MAG: dihydrolipoyl dehydrogenase [SAR202 cluster bacterium]|nr:dihydrolipoyl dehydrogenase [SAR202 cluster bacterium]|tara:strand:- start:1389 stop:2798 length:1410 start_codon:yes stop_codon:yes gene_type:complete